MLNFFIIGPLAFYLWDKRNIALEAEKSRHTEQVQRESSEAMKALTRLVDKLGNKADDQMAKGNPLPKIDPAFVFTFLFISLLFYRSFLLHLISQFIRNFIIPILIFVFLVKWWKQ